MTISLHPFHTGFGAVLHGVALTDELSSVDVAAIHTAVGKHGFLLHQGPVMTEDEQIRFTRRLGEPVGDGREGKLFKIFDERYPFSYWHCDGVFHDPPPRLSIQHMLVGGAETQVMSGYEALARMPDALKQRLEGVMASYNLRNARKVGVPSIAAPDAGPFPLAWRHPTTGRPSLYANLNYARLVGLSTEAGEQLLVEIEAYLRSLVGVADLYHVVPSVAGNTLIVDNRAALHAGPIDPASIPRDRKIRWTGTLTD